MYSLTWCFLIIFQQVMISTARNKTEFTPEEMTDTVMACSKGWYTFNDKCYRLGGKRKPAAISWDKASEECSNLGGTLASINNQEEQDFIVATFILEVRRPTWVGLHDRGKEGEYHWQDGSPVNYTYWAPYEPAGEKYAHEDCTELRFLTNSRNGEWNDLDCNVELPFVCQKDKIEFSVTKVPLDARHCAEDNNSGWKFHNSCYNLIKEKKTWKEAENYCRDHYSGHLVSIRDITVDYFLDYMLKDYADKVWIGIPIKESSVQKWSSGWFVGYSGWRRNKEDFTDGTCATRVKSEEWSTDICTRKYAFMCESSTDVPPSLTPSVEGAVCPQEAEGWKDLGGDMCYFFETEKDVTWYEASFMCLQKGGTLASIHSQAEAKVLHQFVKYTKNELHVGLHRKVQGGSEFVWSDRSPFDFKNWDSGEPNRDIESCSVIYTSHMKFHNYMCDERRGFICSAKKVLPLSATNGTDGALAETPEAAEDCASGVAIPAVIGFVAAELCILCLLAIVLCWYFKPRCFNKRAPASVDVQNLSEFQKSSRYNDQMLGCTVQQQTFNPASYG